MTTRHLCSLSAYLEAEWAARCGHRVRIERRGLLRWVVSDEPATSREQNS